jgi:hypothetical protein
MAGGNHRHPRIDVRALCLNVEVHYPRIGLFRTESVDPALRETRATTDRVGVRAGGQIT